MTKYNERRKEKNINTIYMILSTIETTFLFLRTPVHPLRMDLQIGQAVMAAVMDRVGSYLSWRNDLADNTPILESQAQVLKEVNHKSYNIFNENNLCIYVHDITLLVYKIIPTLFSSFF